MMALAGVERKTHASELRRRKSMMLKFEYLIAKQLIK